MLIHSMLLVDSKVCPLSTQKSPNRIDSCERFIELPAIDAEHNHLSFKSLFDEVISKDSMADSFQSLSEQQTLLHHDLIPYLENIKNGKIIPLTGKIMPFFAADQINLQINEGDELNGLIDSNMGEMANVASEQLTFFQKSLSNEYALSQRQEASIISRAYNNPVSASDNGFIMAVDSNDELVNAMDNVINLNLSIKKLIETSFYNITQPKLPPELLKLVEQQYLDHGKQSSTNYVNFFMSLSDLEATVKVNPSAMGAIRSTIKLTDQGWLIAFEAENQQVFDLIEQSFPKLKNMLEDYGREAVYASMKPWSGAIEDDKKNAQISVYDKEESPARTSDLKKGRNNIQYIANKALVDDYV